MNGCIALYFRDLSTQHGTQKNNGTFKQDTCFTLAAWSKIIFVYLVVDVSGRGHDEQVPRAVLHEGQRAVADLAAGDEEVVLRAEHVPREVVDLDKVGGDERELRLGAGHPDGLDDEVVGVELRVQDEVFGDGPRAVERQHVAVLESRDCEVVLVDRVGEDGENREWDGGRRQPVECTAFIRTSEVRNLILI